MVDTLVPRRRRKHCKAADLSAYILPYYLLSTNRTPIGLHTPLETCQALCTRMQFLHISAPHRPICNLHEERSFASQE